MRSRAYRRDAPVWLFDLDNTLHQASHAIFPFINREMTAYIERTLQVDTTTANQLRVTYTRQYGATLLGLIRRHGVDGHAFLREVHPSAELASLLRVERGLAQTLKRLPGRKVVLTNGPEQYAHDILEILGISRLFDRVIAIEQMRRGNHWHAKPDAAVIRRTLRALRVQPQQAYLVEDTHGHLKRYRRLGLKTVWVTGHLPYFTQGGRRADAVAVSSTPASTAAARQVTTATAVTTADEAAPANHAHATSDNADDGRHGRDAASPLHGAIGRASHGRPHYVDRRVRSIAVLAHRRT